MKKSSHLVSRLLFCAGILMFCCLSFPARGKDTNESPEPWTNSLGMKFVPVPGTEVLFSIWDTRMQDYEAFIKATGRSWEKPNFEQRPTHPAVFVSWDDAKDFCAWLTEKERSVGTLKPSQKYRLPTDLEWSAAVGLGKETGSTPEERNDRIVNVFPWGTQWPPPRGAGNYRPVLKVDAFENTSPVGSFAPNRFGLFDMGGNVWQWCEDFYDGQSGARIDRGASWGDHKLPFVLSSHRSSHDPLKYRTTKIGFRCVLSRGDVSATQAQSDAVTPVATQTPNAKLSSPEAADSPAPPSDTESSLKTLSVQALNATAWALAPLDQSVPPDIRQHLTYLREDLLDEVKAAPKASAEAYKLGSQLCKALIAALDERDQTSVRAGYRAAQADANTKVSSQSLEARRNYMVSWPQYSREKDERAEIQRQQTNGTVLVKESVKVDWSQRTAALRKSLDDLYEKYRDALRQSTN